MTYTYVYVCMYVYVCTVLYSKNGAASEEKYGVASLTQNQQSSGLQWKQCMYTYVQSGSYIHMYVYIYVRMYVYIYVQSEENMGPPTHSSSNLEPGNPSHPRSLNLRHLCLATIKTRARSIKAILQWFFAHQGLLRHFCLVTIKARARSMAIWQCFLLTRDFSFLG